MDKIICFIFGHIRREEVFTGEFASQITDVLGRPTALYIWQYNKVCPRCGKDLKGIRGR
jgi:hypothetical protein